MYSKPSTLLFFCSFILIFFQHIAHAEQQHSGIGIYLDQDLFVPFTNEDRDYTMGIAFEFFWAKDKGLYPLDNLVRQTAELMGIENFDENIVYSFMLGTLAYTPDDLSDTQPIYDDRPYSSLIYLSNKRVRADDKNALAVEMLLGIIGTNLSREVQTAFHSFYRNIAGTIEPVEPKGWSHQISDGGELTVRLRLSRSQLQFSNHGLWDVATTVGFSLGFQTNISVSAAIRLGNIKSKFWSLPYDPVSRGNFLPDPHKDEWYFWSSFRAHLVGYDALLQGQFRHSDVKFSSDEIERVVYDGGLGLTFGFEKSQLTISANTKSSDLKLTSRRQVWGSINYLYYF
jgi:hypothetical protein